MGKIAGREKKTIRETLPEDRKAGGSVTEIDRNTLRITEYKLLGALPDPFTSDDGTRLVSKEQWPSRRKEMYRTAVELQYGIQPPDPEYLEVEPLCLSTVKTYRIVTGTGKKPLSFRMQVILPEITDKKVPVIVDGDQCWRYHMDREYLDAALGRGVGWVFFDRTELASDMAGPDGRACGALYRTYPECTSGALGAWAWGYSRCVDALERLDLPVDTGFIAFSGHSRGGKAAALAGVLDTRARIVNPNDTCAGSCGCYRIHMKGFSGNACEGRSETLDDLMRNFPFWMGEKMEKYRKDESSLPFDTHFLKAMVAPRALFVSEAAGDVWSNPVGSWETTAAASEVYRFLGAEEHLYWYFRPGTHGHRTEDVDMLAGVILHERDGAALDSRMFRLPFEAPGPAYGWSCPAI